MFTFSFSLAFSREIQKVVRNWCGKAKRFFCLGLFLLTLSLTGSVSATLQDGLVGHWAFNETGGMVATDSSGNGNSGTLINGPARLLGKFGQALLFDGSNDYVEVPHANSLSTSSAMTVSVWINNQTLTGADEQRVIASKGWVAGSSGSWTLTWAAKSGLLYFFVGRATSYRYISFPYDNSQSGNWHHIAAVVNNGQISLYQNGVLKAGPNSLDSSTIRTSQDPIRIASSGSGSSTVRNWDGLIDEFRIYNRALSTAEIVSVYQGQVQPPASTFNFSLSNSGSLLVTPGSSATNTITAALVSGSTQPVSFSVSGLPQGANASFSQNTCSPNCSSQLTVSTSSSTPTGSYSLTVKGTAGGLSSLTTVGLTVNSNPFSFSLANSGSLTMTQGSSATNTITATRNSGTTQPVSFSVSGLPQGASASFSQSSCSPTCSSQLTVSTSTSTTAGSYSLVVKGTASSVSSSVAVTLTVKAATSTSTSATGQIVSRFFQQHNTWYQKLASNPQILPNSAGIIDNIEKYSHSLGANSGHWSFPIFYAQSNTPKVTVVVTGSTLTRKAIAHFGWNVVPIPPEARPSGFGSSTYRDGHLVVISHDRKYAWDFYQASRVSATEWRATTLRRWDLSKDGINSPYDFLTMPKLCPIPHLHGLVTYEEIKRGYIDHAVAVTVNNQKTNYWGRYPCEAYIGGGNTNPNPPQGGMRFQLDPSVNIDGLGLSPAGKMVAKALQEYGAVSVMNGGQSDFDVLFENVDFRPDKASWQGLIPSDLNKIPKGKLRVVEAPRPPFTNNATAPTPVRVRAKQKVPVYWSPFDLSVTPRLTLPVGSTGTFQSEPVVLNGIIWWFIDYDDPTSNSHYHGWTRADQLEKLN